MKNLRVCLKMEMLIENIAIVPMSKRKNVIDKGLVLSGVIWTTNLQQFLNQKICNLYKNKFLKKKFFLNHIRMSEKNIVFNDKMIDKNNFYKKTIKDR